MGNREVARFQLQLAPRHVITPQHKKDILKNAFRLQRPSKEQSSKILSKDKSKSKHFISNLVLEYNLLECTQQSHVYKKNHFEKWFSAYHLKNNLARYLLSKDKSKSKDEIFSVVLGTNRIRVLQQRYVTKKTFWKVVSVSKRLGIRIIAKVNILGFSSQMFSPVNILENFLTPKKDKK